MSTSHSTKRSTLARFLLAGLPLGAAALLTRCHLDQLFSPAALGKLRVFPAALADSVGEGSTAPRHRTLTVESAAASLTWRASVASGSAWIQLGQTEDTAPSNLDVILQPNGLEAGVYRDAILLRATSADGGTTRVPVTLVVLSAPPPPPPPTPRRLAFVTQPTTITAGGTIAPPVRVAAQDSAGRTVTGFTGPITLAIGNNPSGGSLGGTRSVDAIDGVATFSDLSVDKEGPGYTLTASAGSLTGATSAAFDVLGTGGGTSATHLWYTVQPTVTDAGAPITPAVRVAAHDANGNVVTDYTGAITMSIRTNPSCANLTGTRTVAAVNGIATFSDLKIDIGGHGYTLLAQAAGLTEMQSSAFNVNSWNLVGCGKPTHLVVLVQPGNTSAGANISPAVRVAAHDNSGNIAGGFTGTITASIGRNPSGGTLSGTMTLTAVNGVVTFNDLQIDRAGQTYTLVFSASGLVDGETIAFNILP